MTTLRSLHPKVQIKRDWHATQVPRGTGRSKHRYIVTGYCYPGMSHSSNRQGDMMPSQLPSFSKQRRASSARADSGSSYRQERQTWQTDPTEALYRFQAVKCLDRERSLQYPICSLVCMRDAKVFSKIDLRSAFWQIPIDWNDMTETGFSTLATRSTIGARWRYGPL
jgi:hypothetical protein